MVIVRLRCRLDFHIVEIDGYTAINVHRNESFYSLEIPYPKKVRSSLRSYAIGCYRYQFQTECIRHYAHFVVHAPWSVAKNKLNLMLDSLLVLHVTARMFSTDFKPKLSTASSSFIYIIFNARCTKEHDDFDRNRAALNGDL